MADTPKNMRDSRGSEPNREQAFSEAAPAAPMLPNLAPRGVFPTSGARLDDAAVSREDEANMRRALGMLGTAPRPAQPAGSPERRAAAGYTASNSHAGSHPGGQGSPRRHRFVQDGEVPVTVVRPRADGAPDLSRAAAVSPVNRLEAVQESLAAEQAARATAERALEEAQATIRALQTRMSHLELARDEALAHLQQVRAQAGLAAARTAEAPADAERRAIPEPPVIEPVARITRRPKRAEPVVEAEPEPVKWWLSSESARATPIKRRRASAVAPD